MWPGSTLDAPTAVRHFERLRGRRQSELADAFVAETKKALVELFGKDPKSNSDYSRIINERAVERLASLFTFHRREKPGT